LRPSVIWWCWLALVAGLLGAMFFAPPPEPPPPLAAVREPVPTLVKPPPNLRIEVTDLTSRLLNSSIWGAPGGRAAVPVAAPASAAEPAWMVSGFYSVAGTRRVVLHYEGRARPSRQLAVGEELPDGSVIEQIDTDRLRVRTRAAAGKPGPLRWIPINRGAKVTDN